MSTYLFTGAVQSPRPKQHEQRPPLHGTCRTMQLVKSQDLTSSPSFYRETRKFLLEPVEEWLAGPLCRTGQELIAALDQWTVSGDLHGDRRTHLADQLNPQTTPGSTQRVFDLISV